MKKSNGFVLILCIMLLSCLNSCAQNIKDFKKELFIDKIYLKSDKIIEGFIIERTPSQTYKIQTSSGIVVFNKNEIKCIRRDWNTKFVSDKKSENDMEMPPPPPPPPPQPTPDDILKEKMKYEKEVKEVENTTPLFKLSAQEFSDEYRFDCYYASEKYSNKVIVITGKVASITYHNLDKSTEPIIDFKVENNALHGFEHIYCVFPMSQKRDVLDKVKEGDQLSVKGKFLFEWKPVDNCNAVMQTNGLRYCSIYYGN